MDVARAVRGLGRERSNPLTADQIAELHSTFESCCVQRKNPPIKSILDVFQEGNKTVDKSPDSNALSCDHSEIYDN